MSHENVELIQQQAEAVNRGKDSGAETHRHFWSVYWIADGKVARREVFLERADALEPAGLSEQGAHADSFDG